MSTATLAPGLAAGHRPRAQNPVHGTYHGLPQYVRMFTEDLAMEDAGAPCAGSTARWCHLCAQPPTAQSW
jgi:hypothetical protein